MHVLGAFSAARVDQAPPELLRLLGRARLEANLEKQLAGDISRMESDELAELFERHCPVPGAAADDYKTRWLRAAMAPPDRTRDLEPGGMVFAGAPDEVAERILQLHSLLGHSRQIVQMDVGDMPHARFLESIELLGTEVLPRIRKELGGF